VYNTLETYAIYVLRVWSCIPRYCVFEQRSIYVSD